MDFMERLTEHINGMPDLPERLRPGYLGAGESFAIYPLPGGRKTQEFMDGTSDQQINYEIGMKSRDHMLINSTLWVVSKCLEGLKELESNDGSFEFKEVEITSTPYINQLDDQGWFVFLLTFQANITVLKEEKVNG